MSATSELWRKANKPVLMFGIRPVIFLPWLVFIFIHKLWLFVPLIIITVFFCVAGYFHVPPRMVGRGLLHHLTGKQKRYRLRWKR